MKTSRVLKKTEQDMLFTSDYRIYDDCRNLKAQKVLLGRRNISMNILEHYMAKHYALHERLSCMESADVYYAIDHFIPTRYSAKDPARNDEPIPEYLGEIARREPLLLDHFLKYEFDQRYGGKYCLCLGDCGMGKTTFLINLFYAALKKKKSCAFVSLSSADCLGEIRKIKKPEKTILLLDALDESDAAMRDYQGFMEKLEREVQHFYRVIITSRTNFFIKAEKENLFSGKRGSSTTNKISSAHKYYIAPLTDEDIKQYLHQRFRGKKYQKALDLVNANKNLSARPLMLRYMDDMVQENIKFSHDFALYEYLFRKWIAREAGNDVLHQQALYDECLALAKAMYYQWMKDGRVGIYPSEINETKEIPGLSGIRFQGHAILNRTSDGMYKFAHRSYWEYLLARLALTDLAFSDDLFIRNFEQAEAFLKEMIEFANSEERGTATFRTITVKLGIANYYLKYWRPEEAEPILIEVLKKEDSLSIQEDLFAQIHLSRCYRYLWKEASAERLILTLIEQFDRINLTVELVPVFTQFGIELGIYSRRRKIKTGQKFLKRVITFCKKNPVPRYSLFVCYERYCHCAINIATKNTALDEMWQIANNYGLLQDDKCDQYVEYLYFLASIWKTPYGDEFSLQCQKKIVYEYTKFFDNNTSIIQKGDLACSIMAAYKKTQSVEFDQAQDEAIELLGQAYDLCCSVYDESKGDFTTIRRPLWALLALQLTRYFRCFDINTQINEKITEENSKLLRFLQSDPFKNEKQIEYCRILDNASKDLTADFSKKEALLLELLKTARSIQCHSEEIEALWSLYILYNKEDGMHEKAQEMLKEAYDLACSDLQYIETTSYCYLLQVMIDFYQGEIDKDALWQKLQSIAPNIFGSDIRRNRVYRCLKDYALKNNKIQAYTFAQEVLRCEFSRWELQSFYDICMQHYDMSYFLQSFEIVLRELPEINANHEKEIRYFLEMITENAVNEPDKEVVNDRDKETWKNYAELTGRGALSSEFSKQVWDIVQRLKQEKSRAKMNLQRNRRFYSFKANTQ